MPTESQIPESELLLRVQQRINDRRLPVVMSSQISAGYGTGRDVCQVCDESIPENKVQYEVGDPRNGNPLMFHFACYVVWQLECARRIVEAERKRSRDSVQPNPPPAASDDGTEGHTLKH
jgi:hypothetical protein